MRAYAIRVGLLVVNLACASASQAGLLEPLSINRYVEAFRYPSDVVQTATGVDPFSATVSTPGGLATATQNSTVTADTISISGSAAAYGDPDLGSSATSYFREQFTLTLRTPYQFSSEWNTGSYVGQNVHFYLSTASETVFEQYTARTGTWTWATGGYLDPGQYTYRVTAFADAYPMSGSSWPSMSFSATFSLTPEPATLALAGLGALSLVRRRRAAAQH